jgi:putative membrane protein
MAASSSRSEAEEQDQEPDPRFSMANERTFLAWNRTALALIAAGLASAQFLRFKPSGLRLLVALPTILLGATLALGSYQRWVRSQRALRRGEPLPSSLMPRALTWGIVLIAAVGAILAVVARVIQS